MEIFLGSSTVEHPAVNRRVVGSNPTRGARQFPALWHFAEGLLYFKRRIFKKILGILKESSSLCVYISE